MFDADKLCGIGLDPSSLTPNIKPRPPPLPVNGKKILTIKEAESVQSSNDLGTEEHEELRLIRKNLKCEFSVILNNNRKSEEIQSDPNYSKLIRSP
jgi:hypothetical protein